jgi:hypothetical protein
MAKAVDHARELRIKQAKPRENFIPVEICEKYMNLLQYKPFESSK